MSTSRSRSPSPRSGPRTTAALSSSSSIPARRASEEPHRRVHHEACDPRPRACHPRGSCQPSSALHSRSAASLADASPVRAPASIRTRRRARPTWRCRRPRPGCCARDGGEAGPEPPAGLRPAPISAAAPAVARRPAGHSPRRRRREPMRSLLRLFLLEEIEDLRRQSRAEVRAVGGCGRPVSCALGPPGRSRRAGHGRPSAERMHQRDLRTAIAAD